MNPKKQKMGPPRVKSPRKISKLEPDPEPMVQESVETPVAEPKSVEPEHVTVVTEQPKQKIEVTPIRQNNTTSFVLRPIRRDSITPVELPKKEVVIQPEPEPAVNHDDDIVSENRGPVQVSPVQPKSAVIKHNNRRSGTRPSSTKQTIEPINPEDRLIDKPIVLDNETLNLLVNAIVDHMADKFVTKAELKSIVIDTLQSMVVPS